MILRPRPGSNQMILMVQDNSSDLNVARWGGSSFVTSAVIAKTVETKNQPFEWVWF